MSEKNSNAAATAAAQKAMRHQRGKKRGEAAAEAFRAALRAVQESDAERLGALLGSAPEILKAHDEDLATLLHHAAAAGGEAIVRLLLEKGADADARDAADRSCAQVASEHGHNGLASGLIRAGGRLKNAGKGDKPVSLLALAAYHGDTETLKSALAAGASVTERDGNGLTPLHYAAQQGRLEAVKRLVKAGADVNVFVEHRNPMLLAAENRHTAVAGYLLRRGSYQSAEQLAVNASVRIARGAVGGVPLPAGGAALRAVALNGRAADLDALLRAGADPDAANEYGETALMNAAGANNRKMVRRLLEAGADPALRDSQERSALDFAAEAGNRSIAKLLDFAAAPAKAPAQETAPPARGLEAGAEPAPA